MKTSYKKRIIIASIFVVVAGFAILNILWFVHYSHFMDYRSVMTKEEVGGEISYAIRKNGYRYSINCPTYLDFGGNLAIVDHNETTDGNEAVLIIWPKLFKENQYGIILHSKDDFNISYQINIDGAGNPLYSDNDSEEYKNDIKSIISENQRTVDGLLEAMRDIWGK